MKLVNDQCIMIVIKLTLHFIYSEEISENMFMLLETGVLPITMLICGKVQELF